MNSNLASETDLEMRAEPAPHAAWRWLPMLIIVAAAAAYYGSYLQYWFNPHDEGGVACLIAQRLMNGERPWVDVEPGYNIGWFYPLIAIFKITGVNYLVARAWFFLLSTITALLGCSIVSRISGSRLLGLGTGLLLVLLPGSQFKNYIQLAQAANTACLIYLVFVNPANRRKWLGTVALGGVVLGLTYLVRVELGYFFTAIWALLLVVFLLDRRLPMLPRIGATLAGLVALAAGVVVAQTPAYLDLRGRGLEKQYWAEYSQWLDFLRGSVTEQVRLIQKPAPDAAAALKRAKQTSEVKPVPPDEPAPATTDAFAAPAPEAPVPATAAAPRSAVQTTSSDAPPSVASAQPSAGTLHSAPNADRNTLPRKAVSNIWHGAWRDRMLALLTFAPFVGFGVFFCAGLVGFLAGAFRRDFALTQRPLLWLLLVGASLTTFPQFFFFRPDRPHLSEFMTGHIIAMSACLWLLWPRGETRPLLARLFAWGMALFLAGQLAVFAVYAMQHPSAGTIAARTGRKAWFHGENGVRVREFKRQAASLQGVHDAVMKASGPNDYVICFPYMPGYNVMTNRPTYLHSVYVDNATYSKNWADTTIRDFEEKKPAVVIIDDRAINGTEGSRFSHWAPKVHDFLRTKYVLAGTFETVEVFTRPPAPAQ